MALHGVELVNVDGLVPHSAYGLDGEVPSPVPPGDGPASVPYWWALISARNSVLSSLSALTPTIGLHPGPDVSDAVLKSAPGLQER